MKNKKKFTKVVTFDNFTPQEKVKLKLQFGSDACDRDLMLVVEFEGHDPSFFRFAKKLPEPGPKMYFRLKDYGLTLVFIHLSMSASVFIGDVYASKIVGDEPLGIDNDVMPSIRQQLESSFESELTDIEHDLHMQAD